jgi:8-oxo-dGTP pyrophosphatase MutT (NUDIX family)
VPDDATLAATVVVLRDATGGAAGIETLLLRRNSRLGFAGGMWVFPGGRVDAADATDVTGGHAFGEEGTARRAAAREAFEEAGIALDAGALVPLSHWTPDPASAHKRFATWFFLAGATPGTVVVDGGEIVDHGWIRPEDALGRHAAGEIELLPPTFVTLADLAAHESVACALDAARGGGVPRYLTRMVRVDGELVALWAGDAGYDSGDGSRDGARHRLLMGSLPWRYVRG